ncbi:MAG TPA: DUF4238 domain-containing protein, partial [Candidatus Bathyarchaeia archaeon]|nr:DUF4238 domain-containing protein [Candidatus Bathyarchaeia archaeon]
KFTNEPWADKNGLIVKFSRRADGALIRGRTGPREWGAENYLYSQDMEDALARLEGLVKPLYEKLLSDKILNPDERLVWSYWLLCQYARTPSFMIELAKLPEDLLARHSSLAAYSAHLNTEEQLKAAQSNIADFSTSRELVPFLVLRDWIVYRAAPGEFFIKSDVPVVIRGPLVEEDTTILYPLSPEKCFSATVAGGLFPPRQLQLEYLLAAGQTVDFVKMIASTADREVICHKDNVSSALVELLTASLAIDSGYTQRHK